MVCFVPSAFRMALSFVQPDKHHLHQAMQNLMGQRRLSYNDEHMNALKDPPL